jgi:opacity protein-like surface antigen
MLGENYNMKKLLGVLIAMLLVSIAYAQEDAQNVQDTQGNAQGNMQESAQENAQEDEQNVPNPQDNAAKSTLPEYLSEDLFRPLLADPMWPAFAVDYVSYTQHRELNEVVNGRFGRAFPFLKSGEDGGTKWETSLWMGMIAMFDLSSTSNDLINTDYRIGLNNTVQLGNLTLIARIFHQSSHLGDEYVLRNAGDPTFVRENMSYESLNVLASYDLNGWLRVYGGGEYIPRGFAEPKDLGPWAYQAGAEVYFDFDSAMLDNIILAVDVKGYNRTDYKPQFSGRIIYHPRGRLYIAGEYYHGPSHNGQFYDEMESYYGLSLMMY